MPEKNLVGLSQGWYKEFWPVSGGCSG